MTPLKNTTRRLTGRDHKILDHVMRYRLTTIEVLGRAVLPGLSPNAVLKVVNRLCRTGYLEKYTLLHPVKYFVLGDASVNSFGVDASRSNALGPQSLPMEYAVLLYAVLGSRQRRRLTPAEVQAKCPWLGTPLANAPHCIDEQGVLELVRVDLGGPADHVARKCFADLGERSRLRDFLTMVARHEFRLVVITATKQKAAAVRQALDRHGLPNDLLLHFSVLPQLLSLTAIRTHA